MGKKNRNKKVKLQQAAIANQRKPVITRKMPEIPAFWVAVIIPVICFVGAWTYPPVATPMELKSYTSQIYLSGLLLIWLWMQRKQPMTTLNFSPVRICFGLLFIYGTLSLLWAANPDFWVYKWNKWYAGFVMFLLGLQIVQNEKNLDTVVNLAILGGLIVATIGIAQYLFEFNGVPQTSFPSSTFGNGNMAGQVMVLTSMLPLYFLFKEKLPTRKIWFYTFSLCLLITYTFYTRTRAVWIASSFEIFLILLFVVFDKVNRSSWLFWNKEKTIASATGLVLFGILINFNAQGFQPFWEIAIFEISSISSEVSSTDIETGSLRYTIWTGASKMLLDHPIIGSGLGNYFELVNHNEYSNFRILGVQRTHNDILELGVELGAIGYLLLFLVIVSMCFILYKLILKSQGQKRILYALLTIAVAGSMMNAQLSFPYQLPVPLVIMPFFVALIVAGAEQLERQFITISLTPWLNKIFLSAATLVFAFITVNDLTWMRDIHALNRIVSGEDNKEWRPLNPIYNQAYFTATRSVSQAVRGMNREDLVFNLMTPTIDYWPDALANVLIMVESHYAKGNYEETEYWGRKMQELQPAGIYLGEYYLMESYAKTGNLEMYSELYDSFKDDPESLLSKSETTYNILHSMAINLGDYERVEIFFSKYMEYFDESITVLANQAIFYNNLGNIPQAIPYMKRVLELNANFPLAEQFREIIKNNPDY